MGSNGPGPNMKINANDMLYEMHLNPLNFGNTCGAQNCQKVISIPKLAQNSTNLPNPSQNHSKQILYT